MNWEIIGNTGMINYWGDEEFITLSDGLVETIQGGIIKNEIERNNKPFKYRKADAEINLDGLIINRDFLKKILYNNCNLLIPYVDDNNELKLYKCEFVIKCIRNNVERIDKEFTLSDGYIGVFKSGGIQIENPDEIIKRIQDKDING